MKKKNDSTIIFVGNKLNGAFVEDVCKVRKYNYLNVPEKGNIKEQFNDLMFIVKDIKCDYIIFDIEQYFNEPAEIVDRIIKMQKLIDGEAVIYMPGFLPDSLLARTLHAEGLNKIIVSGTLTDMKDQLEKILGGFYDTFKREEIKKVEEIKEEEKKFFDSFTTIGVCGSMNRIGTTTQAMQIVRYLQSKNKKACYISLNNNEFIRQVGAWYNSDEEAKDKTSYKGLDMFYQLNVNEAANLGYEYFVYDYGDYSASTFNRELFLREDVKIICSGTKANEIGSLFKIAQSIYYKDAIIVLSFVPEAEKSKVLEIMDSIKIEGVKYSNSKRTFFAGEQNDYFSFDEDSIYDDILKIEDEDEEVVAKPKKKIFKWRKKNG